MKFIEDMHLNNKKVIVRCDFNVPIKDGKVLDNSKIIKSLKTINYLLEKNCRVILLSHLGRINSNDDKKKYTLFPVKECLESLLKMEVTFVADYPNEEIPKDKKLILLENTRYFDYPEKLESNNDLELAKKWAKLGDVFVYDAFASAHRRHASTSGLAFLLPTCIGYLVKQELENLDLVKNPTNPFIVIMGGAKVDDKLPLIKNLLPRCEYLLLGGGIANSFLKAKDINIGSSLATEDENILIDLKCLIELYKEKIILPVDCKEKNNLDFKMVDSLNKEDIIYDIGPKTIIKYGNILKNAQTVFMNGTLGFCEDENFTNGTKNVFDYLDNVSTAVIGGGDTVAAVNLLKPENNFVLSSGGGASLEYIAYQNLPVLEDIK